MVQITVDLSEDRSVLVKAAQFILQFAGYEPPAQVVAPEQRQSAADVLIERGKEITRAEMGQQTMNPVEAFAFALGAPISGSPAAQAVFAASIPELPGIPPIPPAPPAPPAPGIDVDVHGLPWDPRIHASTRAKTADGSWRQKRNVDPNLITQVEIELRATMGAPVPAPPAPGVVPPVPFAGSVAPPAPPITGTPAQASAGAVTGAFPGSGPAPTFPQLMSAITKAFTGGTINQQQIAGAVAKVGLPALPMLASRPDLVGAVATELGIAL